MMLTDEQKQAVHAAVSDGNIHNARKLFKKYPEALKNDYAGGYLSIAASFGQFELTKVLVDELNFDINGIAPGNYNRSPLVEAVNDNHYEVAKWLLERGASLEIGRPVISAVGDGNLKMLKLLVAHGADIHKLYENELEGGQFNALQHAIKWGEKKVEAYLRSLGAKLPTAAKTAKASKFKNPAHQKILDHFTKHFGAAHELASITLIPGPISVSVHIIPPSEKSLCPVLFTIGMSDQPQSVPKGTKAEKYLELFMRLSPDWPITLRALESPRNVWPLQWLRTLAEYPHASGRCFEFPHALLVNEEPPEPLGKGTKFTSLLLLAEPKARGKIKIKNGRTIQLYHVVPLYTEERDFDRDHGTNELLRCFQAHHSPGYVDNKRVNVAKKPRRG